MKNRAIIIDELLHRLKWLILFFPALFVAAQVSTANVTGIVQDASSANIGDASVKLINIQTGRRTIRRQMMTADSRRRG